MGIVFMASADQGDTSMWSANTGQGSSSTDTARTGSRSFKIAEVGAQYLGRTLPQRADYYLRFGFYSLPMGNNSEPQYIRFYETNLHVSIELQISGLFVAKRDTTVLGTSSSGITFNTWACIELYVKIHDTAGVITMKIDGVIVLNLTNVDTRNGDTNGYNSEVRFGVSGTVGTGPSLYIDDVLIRDDAWPGKGGIYVLVPTADGSNNGWTASAGNRYQCVDELPATIADYVSTDIATLNTKQDFAMSDLPDPLSLGFTAISAVSVHPVAKLAAAGTGNIRPYAISNSTTSNGASTPLDTALKHIDHFMTTNPDGGGAWTQAAVNALTAGVETI